MTYYDCPVCSHSIAIDTLEVNDGDRCECPECHTGLIIRSDVDMFDDRYIHIVNLVMAPPIDQANHHHDCKNCGDCRDR